MLILSVNSKKLVTPRPRYLATRSSFVFAGNPDDVRMTATYKVKIWNQLDSVVD